MKQKIYSVKIHETTHLVRATTAHGAKSAAIDDRISVELTPTDELVAALRRGDRIIGEPEAADPAQAALPMDAVDKAVRRFTHPNLADTNDA